MTELKAHPAADQTQPQAERSGADHQPIGYLAYPPHTLSRTEAEALRDIALRKARKFEALTAGEFALLTLHELIDLAKRADGSADGFENGNDSAYLAGDGPLIRARRALAHSARAEIALRVGLQQAVG